MMANVERRARPRTVWLVGFLLSGVVLTGLTCPGVAAAQVPEAGTDSLRPDSVQIPIAPQDAPSDAVPDSIPLQAPPSDAVPDSIELAADSAVAPLVPPDFPAPAAGGWSTATWEWTRDQLSGIPAMTALEFIERLPGVTRFRAGNFGRPEGITAMAMGGSRTRVFLDGFELDPFGAGAYELETLPLLELESIRVERSLMEIRVDIRTYQLDQADAHSIVELGTGVFKTRLLRAIFSRGIGTKSTFTGSYDLVNTRGIGIDEPYSHRSNSFRWTYVPLDRLSIQAEWRRGTIDRKGVEFPTQISRSELLFRARSALTPALMVEGFLGRSTLEEELDEAEDRRKSLQGGVRAALTTSALRADASGRLRSGFDSYPLLPTRELEGNVSLSPGRFLHIEGNGRFASWDGGSSRSGRVKGVLTPVDGLSLFGAIEAGSRPLSGLEQIGVDTLAVLTASEGGGWRGGLELYRGSASLGAAMFGSTLSSVAPFGLDFDERLLLRGTESVSGGEVYGRIPVWRGIAVEGWYARFQDAAERPYTPEDIGRVIVSARGSFYSDQLEPTLILEGIHRGSALVPDVDGSDFATQSAPYQVFDLSLRIRIIDVEAYLLWNNILANRAAIDMPWGPPAIQRIVYGARWRFRG